MDDELVAGWLAKKKGNYYAVLFVDDGKGGKKQKWISLKLKAAGNHARAERLLEEIRKEYTEKGESTIAKETEKHPIKAETPVAVRNSSMLFSELLKEWLESAKPRLEETTYSGYWKCIYKIVAPYFDALKTKASELTPEDIEEFYRQAQPGRKANTLIHYHAVIREALQWGLRKRIVTQNVADLVQKPKKEPFMPNYYTLDDMKELLEKVKGTQLELAVFLGCHYGLRREEIIGLKWDAIDFQYHKINIKHIVTEAQIDGHYKRISMDRAKTQKSLRSLPMDKTVEDFMMDYKAKQDEWKQNFKGKYDHSYDGYVYLWPDGHRVIPSWITATFHDFLKANFPPDKIIRFHDLRHSCASLLRHEGVPMEDIQKWLGHSTIVTTEGLYAHFDQNGNIGSANKLASAFGEQGVDPVKTDPPHM
jgi:integrase